MSDPLLEERQRAAALRRLVLLVLTTTVVTLLLGARPLTLWVEEWPPGAMTDQALALASSWQDLTDRLCLSDLHPRLRYAERWLESVGTATTPAPPDLVCP